MRTKTVTEKPETKKPTKTSSRKKTTTKPKETVEKVEKKPLKLTEKCDICGNTISASWNVRLTALTGRASWHRECSAEKLSLCENCSMELNKLIDDWILKKNPSLKKFN